MGLFDILREFISKTSIHGLKLLAIPNLATLKRLAWTSIFIGLVSYAAHQLQLEVKCNLFFITILKLL